MSHSFSNISYHRHGLQGGFFSVLCLLWQLRVILYCLGKKILAPVYYLLHLLFFQERQNEYSSYHRLFLNKAEKKKRNKKEKKAQADKVMVFTLSCDGLPDIRMFMARRLGALHPSDFGQCGSRGFHIRDRKLDLDDLRFFQGSLRDEAESPFADVLSIPRCFLRLRFLQGQRSAKFKGNRLRKRIACILSSSVTRLIEFQFY